MEENCLVSIITPMYNAKQYISETIESVIAQVYTNWEMIIVDDGSTDESPKVVQEYAKKDARIRYYRQEKNGGIAKARNTAIGYARGRYVAFLDADDLWKPDKLEKTLKFMQEKDTAFVFTGYEFGDQEANGTGKVVHVPEQLDYEHALSRTVIFTSTVMLDLNKLDKELIRMPQVKSEDTATWWKILKAGNIAYGLDENLTVYRRAGKSLSSNKLEAVRRIWKLYQLQGDLSLPKRLRCFVGWAFGAVYRRL